MSSLPMMDSVASENALKLLLGNGAVEYDKEND